MKFYLLFGKWKKKLWAGRTKTNDYFNYLYLNFHSCFLLSKDSQFNDEAVKDDFTSLKDCYIW